VSHHDFGVPCLESHRGSTTPPQEFRNRRWHKHYSHTAEF